MTMHRILRSNPVSWGRRCLAESWPWTRGFRQQTQTLVSKTLQHTHIKHGEGKKKNTTQTKLFGLTIQYSETVNLLSFPAVSKWRTQVPGPAPGLSWSERSWLFTVYQGTELQHFFFTFASYIVGTAMLIHRRGFFLFQSLPQTQHLVLKSVTVPSRTNWASKWIPNIN